MEGLMKRILAALFLLVAVPMAAAAQAPGPMRGMMPNVAKVAIENGDTLGLSAGQITKLEALADTLEESARPLREEMEKLRGSGAGREAMMPLMQKAREQRAESLAAVKAILDETQGKRLDAILASMRPRRGGGTP
jgi:Skp family chaperone for outer membrane proteins